MEATPDIGPTFYPCLTYRDAKSAMSWLNEAFGFKVLAMYEADDGRVEHAEMSFETGVVMLGSVKNHDLNETPGLGLTYIACRDPERLLAKAKAAGATVIRDLVETDYGSQDFIVADPEGNQWSFGTFRPVPEN